MPTVARNPRRKNDFSRAKLDVLGAVEDDDLPTLLVLVRNRDVGGLVGGSDTRLLLALSALVLALSATRADEDLVVRF